MIAISPVIATDVATFQAFQTKILAEVRVVDIAQRLVNAHQAVVAQVHHLAIGRTPLISDKSLTVAFHLLPSILNNLTEPQLVSITYEAEPLIRSPHDALMVMLFVPASTQSSTINNS